LLSARGDDLIQTVEELGPEEACVAEPREKVGLKVMKTWENMGKHGKTWENMGKHYEKKRV